MPTKGCGKAPVGAVAEKQPSKSACTHGTAVHFGTKKQDSRLYLCTRQLTPSATCTPRAAHGILERPGFSGSIQDLGLVKTMFHIDPNLYLVLNRHSLMLVYLKLVSIKCELKLINGRILDLIENVADLGIFLCLSRAD